MSDLREFSESPERHILPPGGTPPIRRRTSGWIYPFFFLLSSYTILCSGAWFGTEEPESYVVVWGLFLLTADLSFLRGGLPYALWLIAILGSHEMGHYIACRYYGIRASPPLFLPGPVAPFGTLGAFIRIRARFPNRVALFDVGVAGPLAGFAVTVSALLFGLSRSKVIPFEGALEGTLGDSLLFLALAEWFAPPVPDGHALLLHPIAYAGWVGVFATALNLLPVGQLDGGHLAYAVSRRVHRWSSLLALGGLFAMGAIYYPAWLFWGLLLTVLMGARHPPLVDESRPLPPSRLLLALVSILILAACFIPFPFPEFTWAAMNGP